LLEVRRQACASIGLSEHRTAVSASPLAKPQPPEPPAKRQRGSLLPMLVVVGSVVSACVILVGFTGAAGLFAVLAVASVAGFVSFHYLLWGWWLTKKFSDETRSETAPRDD